MGITPNVRNALGYEAVMILAEGLRKAKIITSMALKEAMTNKRFKGVINSLELDRYGDPHRPLWLVKVMENGQMKTLRKVP